MHTSFKPGQIWKDTDGNHIQAHGGGILKYGDTFYWYGENRDKSKFVNSDNVNIVGISCYASKDLYNWENRGIVMGANMTDIAHDLYYEHILERPKVIYNKKTKKFVMIVHVDKQDYDYARVGFAVCDSPDGEFEYLGSKWPNRRRSRDITTFVDDNDEAYLITSSDMNSSLRAVKLTDDYLDFDKFNIIYPEIPNKDSQEAPAVFKYEEKYYLISSGCTGWRANEADCAVSDSIMCEWKSIGNPCVGIGADTTFESQSTYVLEYNGNYIFMADRWNKNDLMDSRYIWLPITFDGGIPIIKWYDEWKLV